MPSTFEWDGVSLTPTAVAWPLAVRIVFAGLPWRDPLDDVVAEADRALVEGALAEFRRAAEGLHEPVARRPRNDPDLPLRRWITGRFAARGDRVLYLARDLRTAIAETRHHQERRARRNGDPAHPITMRVLNAQDVRAEPHDLCGRTTLLPGLYDPDDYAPSLLFAHALRQNADPDGVLYDSVRDAGGINLALFRKRYVAIVPAQDIAFDWDGTRIRGWRLVA